MFNHIVEANEKESEMSGGKFGNPKLDFNPEFSDESNKASYTPCIFERDAYLEHSVVFENLKLDDVEEELSEHNYDITDLAYELAYSRYRIAKLEKIIRQAMEQSRVTVEMLGDI